MAQYYVTWDRLIYFAQGGENLAAEAVFKIKEAEDQGKELVRKAGDEARQLVADAKRDGGESKKSILADAAREKKDLMDAAVRRADKRCEAIVSEGAAEREKLLAPPGEKLSSAIKLVMERIVSTNGDR
jgi:vacuolar-type H+-ATPase subunit H